MFSDEILEKIFEHKELEDVTLKDQSMIISIVEKVLDEMGVDLSATVSKS